MRGVKKMYEMHAMLTREYRSLQAWRALVPKSTAWGKHAQTDIDQALEALRVAQSRLFNAIKAEEGKRHKPILFLIPLAMLILTGCGHVDPQYNAPPLPIARSEAQGVPTAGYNGNAGYPGAPTPPLTYPDCPRDQGLCFETGRGPRGEYTCKVNGELFYQVTCSR